MKFFIWGAGNRGRKALELIGQDRVVAFIDKNESRIGTDFCSKQIVSLDKALEFEDKYIIVVTPRVGKEDILSELRNKNINNFMCLDECPSEVLNEDEHKDICEIYSFKNFEFKYGIYGITLFSLFLYEFMRRESNEPVLVDDNETNKDILEMIYDEYNVEQLNDIANKVDKLVLVKDDKEENIINSGIGEIDIEHISDLMENNIAFCNEEIWKYKNIHKNRRCFIVATGPSLKLEDLDLLKKHNEVCISMNRIYNIFDRTEWRPQYYVIEDAKMIEDLADEIAELDLPCKFVASNPEIYWENDKAETSIKYHMIVQDYKDKMPGFSESFDRFVYNGRTVTYVCLQLAAYMGFTEIYLLGVDFNYSNNLYDEKNHFEGYHKSNSKVRLNAIYPEKMILAYEKAKRYGKLHNIKIYNATRGGKLEVFERVNLDDLF